MQGGVGTDLAQASVRTALGNSTRAMGPFWLVCFSDIIKGSMRQMFFVVLLPDRTVVVSKVAKRQ
jgi:hypothetical protein